ncbi:hydrogenase maturation nickel metallochaperone HypA [Telmatospirillum siberiense]|uniref:Hydrogenase maturation factor HypA n=1 Tax=Telmatospirillum siberiense TaxID=382514 RepID=A0A2N3PPP0_9PROT|nr:hydrogenase maturation nickel metallochaperone HypA [Telmatospirillum siberiense]PKU22370.1 hydrogenase maturation nickel metallochaperone HypA [Telmatospirillum siberiense]
MHELTICEALLERIASERDTRHFARVQRIRLEIGRLSCLDPDTLRYAFGIISRETFLEHAVLDIDQPPGRAVCLDCGAEVEITSRQDDCPACKGGRLKTVGGDGMRFVEMEVV